MHSIFMNPFTMIAGAVMVLAPIIIHLINRLRYKRVPWAAMEFLLKSLKRNRRKLILKQLLLLILRCLLVLLVGLLLARFTGSALGIGQPRSTVHVVLLDDTASMTDAWREDGAVATTFQAAKAAIISDIAGGAVEANTPQELVLIRLTNPAEPYHIERLNQQTVAELENYLAEVKPTALHADYALAVEAAKQTFSRDSQVKRVLHIVADFRASDWAGAGIETLAKALRAAIDGEAGQIHLLDVAHPVRSPNTKTAPDHGNLGILDLQPDTRIVGRYLPVEFTIAVANFTAASRKNVRVTVRVNGQARDDSSITIPEAMPGITTATFLASFNEPGVSMVTAKLETEDSGLAVDDLRYAAVEVRERVPLLFVNAEAPPKTPKDAEGFFLRELFQNATKGFQVVEKGLTELEKPGLEQYPAIFLLNTPRLPDKAKANLEAYVRSGGGVFFSLGPQTDVEFFTRWYNEGKGLFPAPLAKATEPPSDEVRLQRLLAQHLKAFPRADTHPIIEHIYRNDRNREVNAYLQVLSVDRHVPVPREQWNTDTGTVDELFTLPNYRSVDGYTEPAQKLMARLPVGQSEYAKYSDRLREHLRKVKELLAAKRPPHALADALDAMLADAADPKVPGAVGLQEFWGMAEQSQLRADVKRLSESLRFGDPLLIASRYGKGRTVLLTTTAGSRWTDWARGPAQPYFVMVMLEVERFLAGVGPDANRVVGSTLEVTLDESKYKPRVERQWLREMPPDAPPKSGETGLAPLDGVGRDGKLTVSSSDASEPGIYVYKLEPKVDGEKTAPVNSNLGFAFNVDTAREGDLRRATRDDLASAAPGAQVHTPGTDLARLLRDRKSDLSESPWFYLVILLVLVCEQALAVNLSYHRKADAATAINLATRTVT